MGGTIAEKVLARASGLTRVEPGQIVEARPDLIMVNDITGPLAVNTIKDIGNPPMKAKDRLVVILDHLVPAVTPDSAELHKTMRSFCKENGVRRLHDVGGGGVCHQVLAEEYVRPGTLVIGADSHTCTLGALAAFATGVGSTDAAAAILTGELWFKVPESVKISLVGKLPRAVFPKDVVLYLVGQIGPDGANYKSVEYHGPLVEDMDMPGRLTICNMGVEFGAKASIVPLDEVTLDYMRSLRNIVLTEEELNCSRPDPQAEYDDALEFDATFLEPMLAAPYSVDNVKPVSELEGIEVDQVFIGSCTNGRFEDLEVAARIMRDRKVARGVRCIVLPCSMKQYMNALKAGVVETLLKAGCVVGPPTCGPCIGGHMGVLGEKEVAVSTSNRNFVGRMGAKGSKVYLSSPATAAATAVMGKITDPRVFM